MQFLDKVEIISIDIYKKNNVKPLVNIGDVGEFIGFRDKRKNVCMVKTNNDIRLLPKNHLKIIK